MSVIGRQGTKKTAFVKKAIDRLNELAVESQRDAEGPHGEADDILCDVLKHLGREDVAEAFGKVRKWYA